VSEAAQSGETGDALAERVAAAMYARDRAAQSLGIAVVEARSGFARVAMRVRDDMINGHDTAHGGFIFALADTAFAYACNSRNERTVALACSISFAAPARAGDHLTAAAEERSGGGRTGTYDVTVTGPDGSVLALFRGTSYRVSGAVV
jgi:acyl-CoA thioesterase